MGVPSLVAPKNCTIWGWRARADMFISRVKRRMLLAETISLCSTLAATFWPRNSATLMTPQAPRPISSSVKWISARATTQEGSDSFDSKSRACASACAILSDMYVACASACANLLDMYVACASACANLLATSSECASDTVSLFVRSLVVISNVADSSFDSLVCCLEIASRSLTCTSDLVSLSWSKSDSTVGMLSSNGEILIFMQWYAFSSSFFKSSNSCAVGYLVSTSSITSVHLVEMLLHSKQSWFMFSTTEVA